MPADIGRAGDRRRLVFGSHSAQDSFKERQIEAFKEDGFDADLFEEDARGISSAVRNREVMRLAYENLGIGGISEATDLRPRFVRRILEYWQIVEPPEGRERPQFPPWQAKPHPDEVTSASGDYAHTPWERR